MSKDPLDGLAEQLRAAYPRACHRGRLDQIEAHVTTLRSLIAQLPDEEAREAAYEESLLALHAAGHLRPEDKRGSIVVPDHAWERLADALARKEGASA